MATGNDEQEDYVFRFRISEAVTGLEEDPLAEMIRLFLVDLQRIGYLCAGGKRVLIDGFVLNNHPDQVLGLK